MNETDTRLVPTLSTEHWALSYLDEVLRDVNEGGETEQTDGDEGDTHICPGTAPEVIPFLLNTQINKILLN